MRANARGALDRCLLHHNMEVMRVFHTTEVIQEVCRNVLEAVLHVLVGVVPDVGELHVAMAGHLDK